ncbi:recQ-mediated genome instability protein 1-like [Prosopis cineraria]|uniref:recQ-mediated genome instability protein 1-like n=1 Tax=Prosopis cineraria TaxID=364024 RepID=UPI00240EFC4B|nr:recQ-mediated genome instability protein 1-like [Prosopis cineraria]
MVIRRLRLDCSDDDEDDTVLAPPPPPPHLETEADLAPQHQTATDLPRSGAAEPLEISDDDFIDVSDSPLPTSPPRNQHPGPQEIPPSSRSNSSEDPGCPISDSLRRLGLSLRREWLDACIRELESSVRGFPGFDVTAKAKLCFEQFLFSDMNYCGSGVLPANVDSMHLVDLPGPYVLQVDEIINISCPLRGRYQQATPGHKRCLKLSMTDGIQRVFGMEYRPVHALEVCALAGLKVAICNVHVRHGLLMLVPETIEILGGLVKQLDEARKRLVDELNKPPRGKRTKNGVLPPLTTRATLAAWPSRGADNIASSNSTVHAAPSIQTNNLNASLRMSDAGNSLTADTLAINAQNAASNLMPDMVSTAEFMHVDTRADSMANQFSSTIAMTKEMDINTVNITGANSAGNLSSHAVSNVMGEHSNDTIHVRRQNSVAAQCSPIAQNVEERKRDRIPIITENALVGSSSRVSNIDDVPMFEADDHPLMLSGDREIPFTYLASLSAKWATMKEKAPFVRGKVKCFLTGVKGFQYKQRKTYELQAYVDDGSLISEIIIDHNIVQKGIGYSPEDVTVALSSEDKKIVQDMKETMRKFQYFLANFEGVMLLELNAKSFPIAIEMNQGCPPCDAWLLLRRLRSLFPGRAQRHSSPEPIVLSP